MEYKNKEKIIFENDSFYSRFDNFPVSPGHLEVISKRHIESTLELNRNEWAELFDGIKSSVKIIKEVDLKDLYEKLLKNPDTQESVRYLEKAHDNLKKDKSIAGFNIGINEGEAAGQTISHLHIHIIPRYIGDQKNPRGGIRKILDIDGVY